MLRQFRIEREWGMLPGDLGRVDPTDAATMWALHVAEERAQ